MQVFKNRVQLAIALYQGRGEFRRVWEFLALRTVGVLGREVVATSGQRLSGSIQELAVGSGRGPLPR